VNKDVYVNEELSRYILLSSYCDVLYCLMYCLKYLYKIHNEVQTSGQSRLIGHQAASLPHTDGSIVFARWRQCVPHLILPNRHPHRTGCAPCWVALSISTPGHVRACPEPAPFRPENCPFRCGNLDPHVSLTRGFLGPSESMPRTGSRSVQPLMQSLRS